MPKYAPFGEAIFGQTVFGAPYVPPPNIAYAPFGEAIFGETVFGQPPVPLFATQLRVTPVGYTGLRVSWVPPGGIIGQILVRSSYGVPTSIYDGVVVLSELQSATPDFFSASYNDTNLLSGQFYYYALFVLQIEQATPQETQYFIAGAAQGLVITFYGLGETFQSWMPDWYLTEDSAIATTAYPDGPGPLVRFLTLIGYEMDWIRSEIESFSTFSNVDYISGAMLPYLGANYGMAYEPELGMTRSRVLIKNAVLLYKTRGIAGDVNHPGGISGAASAFTGYGAVVTLGKNLEIQLDDSAFDRSTGHWEAISSETTLDIVAASSVQGNGPYGFVPIHTLYDPLPVSHSQQDVHGYLPISNNNVMQVSVVGVQMEISTCTPATATTLGIPCFEQATPQPVVVSAYVQPALASTDLESFYVQIDWYGINGNLISSTVGASVMEIAAPGPPVPITGQWVRVYAVGYPPPGAFTYGRTILSVGSITGEHLIDAEQIEINTQATLGPSDWEPPRDIKVNLLPVRQNLVPNPVGLGGLYGWTQTTGSLTPSAAPVDWPANTATGFSIEATAGGAFDISSLKIPLNPGDVYTLSLYLMSTVTDFDVTFAVTYYTALLTPSAGPTTMISTNTDGFTQGALIGFEVPLNAAWMTFDVSTAAASANEVVYMGAPIFAPEASLLPYFDATFLPISDYIFEGTLNQSVSDYYPSLPAKLSRLITALPGYVPIGSTFSLLIGAEALANASEVG